MSDTKYIKENLKDIQYHLEQAYRKAASLISDVLWNHNEEIKKDTHYETSLTNGAITLLTKLKHINDNDLNDLQEEYMKAANGTENDTNDN